MAVPPHAAPVPAAEGSPRLRTRVRAATLGSNRRLGLWILPLFLITGLIGATLAGSLAVLYFGQRVARLEATTAAARAEVEAAGEQVTRTAAEARAAIDEQVAQVQRRLAVTYPVQRPAEAGVYAASAAHPRGEVRVGSAFTVFSDPRETYFVVSYRLVETGGGEAVPQADVLLPGQRLTLRVHSYDADLDVAVLVAQGGPLPVLGWRPPAEPVEPGEAVYLVGVAGQDTPAVVQGWVAGASDRAVVPVLPLNGFVAGGPLVDGRGRVVAISSLSYQPFGEVAGELAYAVPVRRLCERLLRCTREDLGVGQLGEGGAAGPPDAPPPAPAGDEVPADRARAPEPPPSPVASRSPATSPTSSPATGPGSGEDDRGAGPSPPPRPTP